MAKTDATVNKWKEFWTLFDTVYCRFIYSEVTTTYIHIYILSSQLLALLSTVKRMHVFVLQVAQSSKKNIINFNILTDSFSYNLSSGSLILDFRGYGSLLGDEVCPL